MFSGARVSPEEAAEARLDQLLANWATWMSSGTYGRGYPSKIPGLKSRGPDFEEMARDTDIRLARAIDAIIDDLPQNQRLAIHSIWLASVWRLREDISLQYEAARTSLKETMKTRGIV